MTVVTVGITGDPEKDGPALAEAGRKLARPVIACKGCKHVGQPTPGGTLCLHPLLSSEMANYFEGTVETQHPSIEFARTLGDCKPEAVLFEPRV